MTTKMLLPWFPIVLAVGVGGHLLNRSRATLFAGCCALFWVALTQAAYGSLIWTEASVLFALATGSVAIIAIGVWAGRDVVSPAITEATPNSDARERLADDPHASGLDAVAQQVCLFEEWLAEHGGRYNPWPAFGEFIRMSLHAVCGASHVRAVVTEGERIAWVGSAEYAGPSDLVEVLAHLAGEATVRARRFPIVSHPSS